MANMLMINSVQMLKKYKKVGYTQEQAEEQVEILQEIVEEIFKKIKEDTENTKTLTEGKFLYEIEKLRAETKSNLKELELNMLRWVIGLGTTTLIILGGMIAKGFHWF